MRGGARDEGNDKDGGEMSKKKSVEWVLSLTRAVEAPSRQGKDLRNQCASEKVNATRQRLAYSRIELVTVNWNPPLLGDSVS